MSSKKAAIILAAGKGKRMKSDLPKVLHKIDGKPIINYLMKTLSELDFDRTSVVVGFNGEMVITEVESFKPEIVWQRDQRGTGHAVMQAEKDYKNFDGTVLVATGDVPFLAKKSLTELFKLHEQSGAVATCMSADFEDPTGYGRVIRGDEPDSMVAIVEHKDADEEILKIHEINSGIFCFDSRELFKILHRVDDKNAQGEYYLTDVIRLFIGDGKKCAVWKVPDPFEVSGINSTDQLKEAENILKARKKLV
jgi:UDP-N-acetylglucosamine diphosphorylase/glucosamine-1-phosphate N-acetyltransferase